MTVATILVSKIVVATAVAMLAELVQRRAVRRPELAYALWGTVLTLLLIPTLVRIAVPNWLDGERALVANHFLNNTTLAMVGVFWIAGCGFVLLRQWRNLRLLGRLVRYATVAPQRVTHRCASLAAECGIFDRPTVVTARGVFSPFLWQPVRGETRIVIPGTLLEQFSDAAIDSVLRHELIHLRRRDVWRRRLEMLAVALWWWLPTAWFARSRLRELEEWCTDREVLRSNPGGSQAYAHTLLDTEAFLNRGNPLDLVAVSAFARRGSLPARITRIVADRPTPVTRTSRGILACLTILLLSCGLVTPVFPTKAVTASATNTGTKQTADTPSESVGNEDNWTLPDRNAVTVHASDREIVLTWSTDEPTEDPVEIRLLRVSEQGVEPCIWSIVSNDNLAVEDRRFRRGEVAWIFEFLQSDDQLIDREGMRHRQPGLVRYSPRHHQEHEGCTENYSA